VGTSLRRNDARRFRTAYEAAGDAARPHPLAIEPGTVVLFVDGLRMDVGQALAERLGNAGTEVSLDWRLTPVPSVTATAKALVTPVGDSIGGKGKVNEFLPLEKSSGKPATLDALSKAMLARGIQVLDRGSVSPPEKPTSMGYAECGNIDSDGHAMGLRLPGQLKTEVVVCYFRFLGSIRLFQVDGSCRTSSTQRPARSGRE
jgi:hypothetical protein